MRNQVNPEERMKKPIESTCYPVPELWSCFLCHFSHCVTRTCEIFLSVSTNTYEHEVPPVRGHLPTGPIVEPVSVPPVPSLISSVVPFPPLPSAATSLASCGRGAPSYWTQTTFTPRPRALVSLTSRVPSGVSSIPEESGEASFIK